MSRLPFAVIAIRGPTFSRIRTSLVVAVGFLSVSVLGWASDLVWLSSLDLRCMQQGWGQPRADRSLDGQTISIKRRPFTNGVATHAHSTIYAELDGNCRRFMAQVGVDDALGKNQRGSVQFAIIGDDRLLWQSGILRAGDSAVRVDVELTGITNVVLLAGSADDGIDSDHVIWADAAFAMVPGMRPKAVLPPGPAKELALLSRVQYAQCASALTSNQAAPAVALAHNGCRAATSGWIYDCDAAMGQSFRCAATLPRVASQALNSFPDDAAFIAVPNQARQQWLDATWTYTRQLLGLTKTPEWREEVKREVIFLREPGGRERKCPGRTLVRLYQRAAPEHYVQMLYGSSGGPLAFESRVASPVMERISLRLLELLGAGASFDIQNPASLRVGTFFEAGERRFEVTACSYEGVPFLNPARRSNPFHPELDRPGTRTVAEHLKSQEYNSWCWHWWNLYGRVNGIRGNWDASEQRWGNSKITVCHHANLDSYNSVDGKNQGDTQELGASFYQDLEDCHVAQISAHGGPVNDRPQTGRGTKGWFAWGLGPHRLGQGNLRHLMFEGCGILSYWYDRPGRLLTRRWLTHEFIQGLRTVSGFDGGYNGNDRNGWRFFGRYHEGHSIGDSWAFAAIDECPDNAPITVAYGATQLEALSTLWDGRFSINRAAPFWAAAGLWVSIRPRSELLTERTNCVYLSDLQPVSHRQDWGRFAQDMSVGGHVLTIGREMFDRGLGVHANSDTVYRLPPNQFEGFEALIGLDSAVADEQGRPREGGSILFEVYLDTQRVYSSGLVNESIAPLLVRVPLGQARLLRLVVRDAGDGITCDNADWAMARLVPRSAGSR